MVQRAERRGRALWDRSPEQREHAIATMSAIVAGTARGGEVEELARRALIEREVDRVLFWRRWSCRIDDRVGCVLGQTLSSGRGVVLSACHSGAHYFSMRALPAGHPSSTASSARGSWRRRATTTGGVASRAGAKARAAVRSRPVGSFPILAALLRRGERVYLLYDMPGAPRDSFLGKTAMLADGTARLAAETDALIVPLRARRVGSPRVGAGGAGAGPTRARGRRGAARALAAHHERWILEEPAMMTDPNSFGWEGGAGPQGWSRP